MSQEAGRKPPFRGLTYFKDFFAVLEEQYPHASYALVLEEIDFARTVGPIVSGLALIRGGTYELTVPVGFGHIAVIELEFDRSGTLEPVMGGFR